MMLSYRADERAALVFDDLASALDAGLPLETIGGNPQLGDHVLMDLCWQRGVKLRPAEKLSLEAGWKSGSGSAALRKRAAARRRRAEFTRTVQSALAYPALLFVLLPLCALATMSIVGPAVAIVIAGVYLVLCVLLVVLMRKLGRGDSALERYPVVGGVVLEMREMPYLETLNALYAAGVPIVDAHRTAVATVRMQGLREQLGVAQRLLEQGRPLREALETSASLSKETRALIATGEQAGQLEDSLDRALTRRTEVAERKLRAAARLIGAVAYGLAVIGVASIVVLFYLNYYAPIFSMMR
ncbi:MAG: type II secretion system F family protein [Planctomycetes bacterium]|nr:type II secretion system F family protein [Planctomycetota bacterium]